MIESRYEHFLKLTNDPGAAATLVLAETISVKNRLLTVAEAAEQLGVGAKKVYQMCEDGTIKCQRVGRQIRIEPDAITTILQPDGDPTDYMRHFQAASSSRVA